MLATSLYSDPELLKLLRENDETAFTEIYRRYWQSLFFMAHKRLSSAEDAKEVIQNVFFNLWNKRHQLEIQTLSLYLAGMTRFAVYRHLSNEKRRVEQLRSYQINKADRAAPLSDFDNRQILEILMQFTEGLPEKYRIIFIHNKLLDKPLEEVAEQLGISPRTAEAYLTKVMQIMRSHRQKLALSLLFL